jgi:hypothetical protein
MARGVSFFERLFPRVDVIVTAMGDEEARYARDVRWIELVCLGFGALGLGLPFAYGTPMFAIYRDGLVAMSGDAALATDSPTLTLCLGMTGGSIAGKWLAHYAVARLGLRAHQRWAREATLAGLLGWLVLDSCVSLASGAWLNVAVINPMPPLLLLPLLARIWRRCDRPVSLPTPTPTARVALGAMGLGVLSGLVIALLGDGAPFAPWRDALGAAHFGSTVGGGAAVPEAARAIVRWFLGPIGGATLGHFVLLVFLVRHASAVGARVAYGWAIASVLAWFVTDSGYSLASGALFNVTMVNLPSMLLAVVPLAIAWGSAPPAAARAA